MYYLMVVDIVASGVYGATTVPPNVYNICTTFVNIIMWVSYLRRVVLQPYYR